MSFYRRMAGQMGRVAARRRSVGAAPIVVESVTATPPTSTLGHATFNMPAVRPDGDLYIVHIARDGGAPDYTTGLEAWNVIWNLPNLAINTMRTLVAWKFGSSEPATYKFDHAATVAEYHVTHVLRISGAHATPVDGSASARADSGTVATAPNVVAAHAGGLTLRFFQCDADSFSISAAGGDVVQLYRAGGGVTSGDQGAAGYREPGPTVGVGTGTLDQTGFSDNWFAGTVILRAAGT